MFYRAGLDFAAKFIFNQSDASIDDVTIVEEDSKWRPCLLWVVLLQNYERFCKQTFLSKAYFGQEEK